MRTGYVDLDQLLARLLRRKEKRLKVLERPEIPLRTNASENDLRSCVIKRKISGGTMSRDGRVASDTMLGLMKTCKKLGLSFWHHLGNRLGIPNQQPTTPELASSSSQKPDHAYLRPPGFENGTICPAFAGTSSII
ncbi:transposase [Ochrobactrum sp. Q0168]|uniref:IS66 family transposase n=1 Tax=Ochrobactrum sp. Q0168 TaxID=2793241 RepID=UPI0035301C73